MSNVVKPECKEEMNLAESAESSGEVEIQEINSIRRKAKALQIDMDGLIREISELSQSTSNKVKVKLRIERLTVHREKYRRGYDRRRTSQMGRSFTCGK